MMLINRHQNVSKLVFLFKGERINLIENGKTISNDTELCDIFNGF